MPEGKYFYIRSCLNGKVLDIKGSSSDPGTEVCMWDEHGGDNQLWYRDPEKGVIRSKLNDMCLEVQMSSNRLVIMDYDTRNAFNQTFNIGEERIQHSHFRERVFDIVGNNDDNGAEVCTWEWHGGDNQRWSFDHQEPQYFHIVSALNGKVLDIRGGNIEEGTDIITWEKHGGDNQQWYEDKNGVIRSKVGDFAMNLPDEQGTAVQLVEFKVGLPKTMWGFQGETLVNFALNDVCLDVEGANEDDGADVIAWKYHGNSNQQWYREYVD